MQTSLIKAALKALYGKRCPDFEPGCPTCEAWGQYDALKVAAEVAEAERKAKADKQAATRRAWSERRERTMPD